MSIESATYISELNDAYPEPEADRNTADNHLRLIKNVLLNTFPNLDGEVTTIPDDLNQLGDALELIDGVTSNIQTQLNAKLNDTTDTFTGTLTITGNVAATVNSAGGYAGYFANANAAGYGAYGAGIYGVYGIANAAAGTGVIGLTNSGSVYALLGYNNTYAVWTAGNAYIGGDLTASGNITAYSDRSLKTNLVQITDALDKVSKLNGYTFNWKEAPDGPRQTGMIAQEVMEVLPEAVLEVEGKLSLAYGNLVGLLVEAIKELQSQVEALRRGD